jgi:hypothetical protein
MKTLTPSETSALAGFVQSVLQDFAPGGNQSGPALVAALEPGAIPPAVAAAYLKLWKPKRRQ